MERDFTQQPPLVSHAVDNYPVTMNFNKCMDCHSWERYREMKATKVSQTHFKTSEGQDLANISPRRYFCLQCHVPQIDAKPLVANSYERAKSSR
jgi:cytochrome c-type protein NapB